MIKDKALMQMLNEINAGLKTALTRVNELVAENKALKEALAQPEQEPVALKWQQAPIRTAWGDDMVVASVAIDNDHTLSLYCERDQTPKIDAMFAHPQQEPISLRRGDILRCIETDELCTVWATSTTGKTLIKWSANNFGNYTAEQIGELFWIELEPAAQPEQRPWVGLTDEDMPNKELDAFCRGARWADTKLKEKNT